ncbi:alpha-L-Rha alpha-1,3-L-rhamnosyltransferase [Halalkalibacter wakoensis JCM 9140]|uniref:Alpha-L-Rha alpha-1,3-L-rhamnosyltransferase n=1 Tax=Halalkalibacter wakoensis JCM 9140 TaxID=1236970 RepID=W4Q3G8_9BACI|nr:alpha-L-Rha alpha-1,3-L-rhamnosyltransferase [Halalkalibacter wakoensis JCM 9140]
MNSLLMQSHTHFVLFIRDDGSSDETCTMINEYATKHINVVFVNEDAKENVGVSHSFSTLLEYALARDEQFGYFMFVDQDDVWLEDKIKRTLLKMKTLESKATSSTPILVHTDLFVVDDKLEPIADSFWKFQNIDPQRSQLHEIILQNVVTGCTVMVNRSLVEKALPIPKEAIMHDWWLAMVAACFGEVGVVEEPTIHYRQHQENVVGAKKFKLKPLLDKINQQVVGKKVKQTRAFLEKYSLDISKNTRQMLGAFIRLESASRSKRLLTMVTYQFYMKGLSRNIGLIYLFLMRRNL